jgi:hypothetical protein
LKHTPFTLISIFILLLLASCRPAATELPPTPTGTPDLRTPLALTAEAQTQLAADAQATLDAQATDDSQAATAAFEASATADSLNATATIVMQRTETSGTAQAKNTQTAATRQAGTQQAITAATEQAQPMADLLTTLQTDGWLTSTDGEFTPMIDFDESWAQINWFQWYPTFLSPTSFVIRADITYESASDVANWFNSGCGFVFRYEDNDNFYVTFMKLDGNVEVSRWHNGYGTTLQNSYYGKLDLPRGSAEMVLIAEGPSIIILINGQKVVRLSDSVFTSGDLFYTLVSGTNKDFGTRCKMTNVGLWELK